jgi:tetratricopeptide (TPR) repeat protein
VGLALGLWGEAGIGKTYTVQQLLGQIPCRSFSLHSTVPLAQLVQTLPSSSRLEVWAETIMTRLGRGEIIPAHTAADAIVALLATLAPVVLYLEDLHEAPPERIEFIEQLARRIRRSKGIGLLVTSRGELPESIEGIGLRPLSAEDSNALLVKLSGAELPGQACDWIFARAAGNPLFTTEYFRHLTRMGCIWSDGQRWHWRVPQQQTMPATVEALIERTLTNSATSQVLSKVLSAKALLPQGVDPIIAASLAEVGLDQLAWAQHELSRYGILTGSEFVHPLFKEVAAQRLPLSGRKELSRAAVKLFIETPVLAADYIEEAGLADEQAFAVLKQAAEAADTDAQAGRFWLKSLKYVSQEERESFTLEVVKHIQDSDNQTALSLLRQHLSAYPDNLEARYALIALLARELHRQEAEQVYFSLPEAEQRSARGRVTWIEMLSFFQDNVATMAYWEQHFADQPDPHPIAVGAWVNALRRQSKLDAAAELCLAVLTRTDLDPWVRIRLTNDLGMIYLDLHRYDLAEQTFSGVIALMEQVDMAQRKYVPLYNRALALKWIGRFAEATADTQLSYRLASQAGQLFQMAQSQSLLGELALEQGQYPEAEDLLQTCAALQSRSIASIQAIDTYNNLCSLYRDWVLPHAGLLALKYGDRAVSLARESSSSWLWLVDALFNNAMAETNYGSTAKALDLLAEAHDLVGQLEEPYAKYLVAWAMGHTQFVLGNLEAAKGLLQTAHDGAVQVGHVLSQNKIGLEMARVQNDTQQARQHLEWFESNGLHNGANLARRYFPELGEQRTGLREPGTEKSIPGARNPEPETRPFLAVLGPMQISRNGQATLLRGRKRQEFLALLLGARMAARPEVSRLALLETLYPEEDELKAGAALKQLVSSVRETLDEGAILTTATGYALGQVQSDAEAFLQTGDPALWRGAYLQDLNLGTGADDLLYLALSAKVKTLLSENSAEAARLGRILLEGEPYSPESLQLCLLALRASGNHRTLGRLYEEAKQRMREVGQELPEKWGEFLS